MSKNEGKCDVWWSGFQFEKQFCIFFSSNFVAHKGFILENNTIGRLLLSLDLALVGLEGHLKDPVAKRVSIETLDGHQGFVIVGHGDESKTFAFVGLQVSDDLDVLDSSKGSKQLPENVLFSFWSKIVDKDAPAGSICCHSRKKGASSQEITSKRREPFLQV